jgi:hypothetical protein
MTSDTPKERPSAKTGRTGKAGDRQARLAASLRDNLARRKTQARQRPRPPSEAQTPREDERD